MSLDQKSQTHQFNLFILIADITSKTECGPAQCRIFYLIELWLFAMGSKF
jgi:hypothetical protein